VTITASKIFEFLDQHPACVIDRYEVHSLVFSTLRRSVRAIIARLSEGDEADSQQVADTLRTLLSEWLTVPICFDGVLLESISALGEPRAVEVKWGREVRTAYDLAYKAATEIQCEENPARAQLRAIVKRLRADGRQWRIYCHSRALVHFQSICPETPIPMDCFLHSVKDYREVEPFDVLLKMGPLRSRGWGAAPDALLNAPRFATLVQAVWSGCADEEDFGYDPTVAARGNGAPVPTTSNAQDSALSIVSWKRNVITVGNISHDVPNSDFDELAFFTQLNRGSEMRRATLVQLDAENGILYPPHSQVASFDLAPSEKDQIGYRLPGETLMEGMFVIVPILGTADLGGIHSGEGHYSRIWKETLKEKRQNAPNDLLKRLRESGIQLRNLSHSIQRWCRTATSVIHAPQTRRHFEILITVLGIQHDNTAARTAKHAWWEYAWSEIARSRGEAIQTGIQEHEIVYEELFGILSDMLRELRSSAQNREFFEVQIPANKPLQGVIRFYRVRSLEENFLVPDTMLKIICDLDTVEQWRV
jgi:hypothetical protein